MSDYIISQIYPSDILANKQINELLLAKVSAEMQILTTPAICMMMR